MKKTQFDPNEKRFIQVPDDLSIKEAAGLLNHGFKISSPSLSLLAGMLANKLRVGGQFFLEHFRKGKLLYEGFSDNLVTNQGLNSILDVYLHASTQITTWYLAVFESDTTILATHTYAVPGFTECTAYDEATRPEYVEAAASSQSITNSANKGVFTFNASKTIYGGALVGGGTGGDTKGDTAGGGTLFCASQFGSSRAVLDDDVINLTYTISAADA